MPAVVVVVVVDSAAVQSSFSQAAKGLCLKRIGVALDAMGEQVDVIWFNNMGVFSEPIFSVGFMSLTMKQMVLLFGGLLMAYAISAASPYTALAVAGTVLLMAFYKPRVMPVEEYVTSAIRFFMIHGSRSTEKKYIASVMGGSGNNCNGNGRKVAIEREKQEQPKGDRRQQKKRLFLF
jgi:hypothetical protein